LNINISHDNVAKYLKISGTRYNHFIANLLLLSVPVKNLKICQYFMKL